MLIFLFWLSEHLNMLQIILDHIIRLRDFCRSGLRKCSTDLRKLLIHAVCPNIILTEQTKVDTFVLKLGTKYS